MTTTLIILELFAGWAAADAVGGLFHLATDRGFNVAFFVRQFQNHHDRPETMTFDLQPLAAAIPLAAMAVWYLPAPAFFLTLAIGIGFTQIPHYYIHHPRRRPGWIHTLQRCRLVLTPHKHNSHHRPPHDANFCILAGWSDFWINRLASIKGATMKIVAVALLSAIIGGLITAAGFAVWLISDFHDL